MIVELIGVLVSGISAGVSFLIMLNQRNARLNERLTRMETRMEDYVDVPVRMARLEVTMEAGQRQLIELEKDLKQGMNELKEIQVQILKGTLNR